MQILHKTCIFSFALFSLYRVIPVGFGFICIQLHVYALFFCVIFDTFVFLLSRVPSIGVKAESPAPA